MGPRQPGRAKISPERKVALGPVPGHAAWRGRKSLSEATLRLSHGRGLPAHPRSRSRANGVDPFHMLRPVTTICCIQCGQNTGDVTRFNRLPDGRACPACAERLLDMLPPLLPGVPQDSLDQPVEELEAVDDDGDYDRPA